MRLLFHERAKGGTNPHKCQNELPTVQRHPQKTSGSLYKPKNKKKIKKKRT